MKLSFLLVFGALVAADAQNPPGGKGGKVGKGGKGGGGGGGGGKGPGGGKGAKMPSTAPSSAP